jgi:hypothetical protein
MVQFATNARCWFSKIDDLLVGGQIRADAWSSLMRRQIWLTRSQFDAWSDLADAKADLREETRCPKQKACPDGCRGRRNYQDWLRFP